jgi:type VI secretion system protein ImpL
MEVIRAVGVQDLKKDFQEVIKNQCLRILEKIDEIFEGDSPYEPQQESITHWRGKEQIFQSFGVGDETQLVAHLNLQRQRMNYLGREFAEPIVKILAVLYEKDLGKPAVLEKWDQILTQLNLYQRGSSNAILSLEKFIAIDLTQMNVANCPMVLASVTEDGGNYFNTKQEKLRSRLKAQCKSANLKASESAYIKLANLFNSTLSGRYPFVPRGFTKYPDATIEDVENFYKLFEAQGYYAIELLRLKVKKQSCARKALNFLLKMEKLRPFFNLLLPKISEKEPEKEATPSLPFEINFRTNKSREKEANQIISWILKIGEETYEFSDTKIKGRWSYNDEIALEMRWALGSPYHPIQVKAQPALESGPLTATFRYKGCWAFLKMLELQKPFVSDFPDSKDPSPSTLRFDIPTALKDPIYQGISSQENISEKSPPVAKVFMSLNPVSPELKSFTLPLFPVEAPPLSLLEATKVSGKVFKKPKKSLASDNCGTSESCKKPKKSKKKSISSRKKGKKK